MALHFLTSGESHGPELNIILEGIPANMPLVDEDINHDLRRRQAGYGRGARMKIEKDRAILTAGVRHARTFGGAPIGLKIINKDHEKWIELMTPHLADDHATEIQEALAAKFISKVRPGHADLAGAIKYDSTDVRDILERSSARETTSRVAAGAVCRKFLSLFGIEIFSQVLRIGEISVQGLDEDTLCTSKRPKHWTEYEHLRFEEFRKQVDASELRIYDPNGSEGSVSKQMKSHIDAIRKAGDTVGGLVEVGVRGLPIGLGTHVQWADRLDARVAHSLMSVHTVKSVEIGMGKGVAVHRGSQVHDQIYINPDYDKNHKEFLKAVEGIETLMTEQKSNRYAEGHQSHMVLADKACLKMQELLRKYPPQSFMRYVREENNLGGFEGGMTNGQPIVARVAVKPIPTLVSRLNAADLATQGPAESHFERSDVCVVPAAGVVLEAMLAYTVAEAFLAKFSGDSMQEIIRNYIGYLKQSALR